jgi:hypothetical protein
MRSRQHASEEIRTTLCDPVSPVVKGFSSPQQDKTFEAAEARI